MKRLSLILLPLLVALVSCMKPMDSDFSSRSGLLDDEMLWVMQIPSDSQMTDMDLNENEEGKLRLHNMLFFDQIIPLMFKDMIAGDLIAYENYGTFADDLTQVRLNEKLRNLEISKTDFSPFLLKAELFSIVETNSYSYRHIPRFLRLIAVDTTGSQPPQPFAGAFIEDLNRMNYNVTYPSGKSITLQRYFEREDFYYLPNYVRSNFREYRIESGEEAKYVKDLVTDGAWTSIEWVEGQINVSGKKKLNVDDLSGLSLTGSYQVSFADSVEEELPELFLTAEKDYLVADWSNRFDIEKIFPYEDNSYFSSGGELYVFEDPTDSLVALTFISNGDTTKLVGESDWVTPF